MLHKPIAMSAIALVAVAAILMLGTLAAISTTKQAFAQHIVRSYTERDYKNGLTYSCQDIQSGTSYHTFTKCKPIKPGAQQEQESQTALQKGKPIKSGAQQEQESQTALQKDCMQLKAKMANDEAAAAQYKSKDCESLFKRAYRVESPIE